ncbi:tRNA pseudouridine(38-40) synthase TruA [Flavobacteriaceae bacterium]|jgi:tRNA pseudouridine38-40 synthase|nr:tRNA pseudouridine(38-40) synthase TruA [Flavobacteriaceae bacterium]MDB4182805.1 tRNA pseudouridine(38-40) synthase TruA [Flavobacteriaceae bacterium]MDC0092544.1 tRNA pseudouridine(38-40) synthase TruA [bacterium]
MMQKRYFYLVKVQFLGYRFHGWQKQPNTKTVHLMIDRTLKFILGEQSFKTLGAGRTDAMVSASEAAFELFLDGQPLQDLVEFMGTFNQNLPQDIRVLSIEEVDAKFNIIQDSKLKQYHYVFAQGEKFHPFAAPILTTILEPLDIDLMKEGALLFQGKNNYKTYCYKPTNEGVYDRELIGCELIENTLYTASFFPKKSYILKVIGKGFGRHQIRLMMGALIKLGRGEIDLEFIKDSLKSESEIVMDYIAPASGLILHKIEFKKP